MHVGHQRRDLAEGGFVPGLPGADHDVADAQVSPRFARLWASRVISTGGGSNSKTIVHPSVGPITLDCDVLTVAGSDLRIVVYTADPSSPDADRLRLTQVIGLQELGPRDAP